MARLANSKNYADVDNTCDLVGVGTWNNQLTAPHCHWFKLLKHPTDSPSLPLVQTIETTDSPSLPLAQTIETTNWQLLIATGSNYWNNQLTAPHCHWLKLLKQPTDNSSLPLVQTIETNNWQPLIATGSNYWNNQLTTPHCHWLKLLKQPTDSPSLPLAKIGYNRWHILVFLSQSLLDNVPCTQLSLLSY